MPRFGDVKSQDGLIQDGLLDKYNQVHMGVCAEKAAEKYHISREDQDAYAIRSFERARAAWKAGMFKDEIAPVTVSGRQSNTVVTEDEGYDSLQRDKIPTLKSAFVPGGTVTAANSSTMNDGASAVVLGNKEVARQYGHGSRVLAKIVSSADAALDPLDYPVAPAKAVLLALERAGLLKSDIAIWELNEAFAAVVKANEMVSLLAPATTYPNAC
jgi:acetyl-CoA C-acetyltransferase